MQKFFWVCTITLLLIISVGYFKNFYTIFTLVKRAEQNPINTPKNWVVDYITKDLSFKMKLQKGDALVRVNTNIQDDFNTLNNEIVLNKGKTIELEIMRMGKRIVVNSEIPADLTFNDQEDRLVFKPVYAGKTELISIQPYTKRRLIIGEVIIGLMGLWALVSAVLIALNKRIGWYLAAVFLLVGTFGFIRNGGTQTQLILRATLFSASAVALFLSYEKKPRELIK